MVIEWGSVPWNRSGQAEVRDADDPLSPQAHHSGSGNRSLNEEICHSVNLQSTCDIEPYEPGGYRAGRSTGSKRQSNVGTVPVLCMSATDGTDTSTVLQVGALSAVGALPTPPSPGVL